MESRPVNGRVPSFLPECKHARAYYLENKDDLEKALFEYCVAHRISIYNWNPRFDNDRDGYDKFLREYHGGTEKIEAPYEITAGWYMFQIYTYKDTHWNDYREEEVETLEDCVTVDSIAAAKERVDGFLEQFGMVETARVSYTDLLAKLDDAVRSDVRIPENVKEKVRNGLNSLNSMKELLGPYDTVKHGMG